MSRASSLAGGGSAYPSPDRLPPQRASRLSRHPSYGSLRGDRPPSDGGSQLSRRSDGAARLSDGGQSDGRQTLSMWQAELGDSVAIDMLPLNLPRRSGSSSAAVAATASLTSGGPLQQQRAAPSSPRAAPTLLPVSTASLR